QAYQKSFKEGEYNIKEQVYYLGAQTIRNYMSGGIAFGDIANTIASSAISSKRDMFGVKNLIELFISGNNTQDPFNIQISRRGFLRVAGGAAVATAAALNPTAAAALELAAARSRPARRSSKQSERNEKTKNSYEIPVDAQYISKLQAGLSAQLREIPPEALREFIEYSNSAVSQKFIGLAYALLNNQGLYSNRQKQYKVLFFPGLKTVSGQGIVLEDLGLIVLGRDIFQWLKAGILEKWLAIKILQEVTRANYKGRMFLENEIKVHQVTLAAMEKIEGIPLGCIEAERKLLSTFESIVKNPVNAESVMYKFAVGTLQGINYDENIRITIPQERGDPKGGITIITLKLGPRPATFGITPDGTLGGVTEAWLQDVKTNSLFNIQKDFMFALSASVPNARSGLDAEESLRASSAISNQSLLPIAYYDPDRNKAMDFLKKDTSAWVIFSDMLKLSLRNDYYGMNISDIFIADAIRITKETLGLRGWIGFRLGDRSDEIAMVLSGSLKPEEVKSVLQDIQKQIKKEYSGYGIARLPDGLVDKIKNADGMRMVQSTSRERQDGSAEGITTALFIKDKGDASGRLTLDKILKESNQIAGLGEVEEALPPYLPAGAARLQGEGTIENKFEFSLKEAEIFQRVAKQAGQVIGVDGLNEKPQTKAGTSLYDSEPLKLKEYINVSEKSLQSLREFVRARYGVNEAKKIQLDDGYAAFMRRNLYEVLEYALEKSKSADSFIFTVRGPPDNFYIITAAQGKWQITAVRQNILTAQGSSLEKDFLSIVQASGRGLRAEGKYPFKVINDFEELGHYFGNQLIKLDNINLTEAFNAQLDKNKGQGGLLSEQSIGAALSEASKNISNLLSEKGFGFSINFEAVSVTSDDFLEQKNQPNAEVIKETLNIIEKLNAAREVV
ncbi:MAG: hypothetical protein PHU59_06065, partial [Candidatus Omnitrophica bacterium]|nr:hypothetical protein [Candidatus Omnitrophota bacterium]